jgi:ketosteroid isomerase-like protein
MKWLLFVLLAVSATASGTDNASVAQRLQRANDGIAADWRSSNAASLGERYAVEATLMPEHSAVRRGAAAIADYYAALFDAVRVEDYRRTSHDVVVYGQHAVQTGRYTLAFSHADAAGKTFDGKFMALWELSAPEPRLVCELWGTDAPFDPALWPRITATSTADARPADVDAALVREISTRNALIDTLVTERRGAEHAKLFFPDAIYLTYYTPMRVGEAQIREYFVEHEKPGDVTIESLELRSGKLHALEGREVVLEEGFYRVGWRAGVAHGVVDGKSLNLWKRDETGTLKLFRQAVNHD